MSVTTKKNYKATLILDLRGSKEGPTEIIAELNKILKSIGGILVESEDLGAREFARAAERSFTQGHYIEVYFEGSNSIPMTLSEKLKLDKRINRIFIESE